MAALAAVAILAGCGNSRTAAPSVTTPRPPQGFRTVTVTRYRLALSVPRNWTELPNQARAPLLLVLTSGEAVVALSRYPRSVPPPADAGQLQLAENALLRTIRSRQRGVRVASARTLRVTGQPAIQLRLTERIGGSVRQVISTHVFLSHSEVVLEEYAPPGVFAAVAGTFARIAASLRRTPGAAA